MSGKIPDGQEEPALVHNRDWQIWADMGRYGQRWAEGCPQPRKMIQVMIACHKNQQATTRERPPWSSAVSHQVCCTTLEGPHHFFFCRCAVAGRQPSHQPAYVVQKRMITIPTRPSAWVCVVASVHFCGHPRLLGKTKGRGSHSMERQNTPQKCDLLYHLLVQHGQVSSNRQYTSITRQ